jgi:hypothetical protein
MLVGPPAESGDFPTVYIGECDPLRPRLEQHYAKKDFWTGVIAFTSKDENLNKAHVQFLESRFVALAVQLDNGNTPAPPSLSEADVAEMEAFIDEMLVILPVIGLSVFETPQVGAVPHRKLTLKGKGAIGNGYESDAGFVVLAGSEMRAETVESISPHLMPLRQKLLSKGIVAKVNGALRFAQDYTFDSPSTAAGVLLGRSANGRIEWRDQFGHTLKQLQAGDVSVKAEGA